MFDHLDEVIAEVSGPERYRFDDRQLFYRLRPIIVAETGKELKLSNWKSILDAYEGENGEIELMYREPRGSLIHPHRNETFALGTLMVEQYVRPEWTFNKLLYIEKEGAQEALKQDRWLERHDCAVMSSKGFSTRAARDLIDKLVEHDEPIEIFCAHDADASGTMIYQTLQEATRARGPARSRSSTSAWSRGRRSQWGLRSRRSKRANVASLSPTTSACTRATTTIGTSGSRPTASNSTP